jgi:hypothetical protein
MLLPAAVMVMAILTLTGCRGGLLGDMGLDFAESTDPNLLKVVQPEGGTYIAGETLEMAWESTVDPPDVDIHLYESGTLVTEIRRDLEDTHRHRWTVPGDLPASHHYQVVVKGYHPQQGAGELLLTAFSEPFTILPAR